MATDTKITAAVTALKNGDGDAFNLIYEQTNQWAYFTALKIVKNEDDAQDVLQEAYVTLLNRIGTLGNPEAFNGWFKMIVANKARDYLRKNNPLLFRDEQEEQLVLDSIEETDEAYQPGLDVEQEEVRDSVMELIDSLSDEKRTVILLYFYNEMTTKQIAEALGVNENTIKSRLVQAKKDLAKGIAGLEKKNKKLLGVAPIPLVIWALKGTGTTASAAFVASGAAAEVLTAVAATQVVAGTAAAGTAAAGAAASGGVLAKLLGLGVAQKIAVGVVAVGVATGAAVAVKTAVTNQKPDSALTTQAVTEQATEPHTDAFAALDGE